MTRPEKIGYATAALVLVVGGAFVRTAILNWIVGPAIVVACVAVSQRLATRRSDADGATDAVDTPHTVDGVAP